MAPQIGSVLLASANPKQLRDWYVEAFAPGVDKTPDGAYDVLNFGGFYVMIDSRDDVGERNPEPGRLIVNVEVDDARAVAAKLDAMSTAWLAELEDRDGSLFATAIDPDGNYVQIIELSEAHRAEMG